eukprot:354208-Chlamydomonas_euryale.AAC.3
MADMEWQTGIPALLSKCFAGRQKQDVINTIFKRSLERHVKYETSAWLPKDSVTCPVTLSLGTVDSLEGLNFEQLSHQDLLLFAEFQDLVCEDQNYRSQPDSGMSATNIPMWQAVWDQSA